MPKRRGPARPSEADLERAARDFLALDGWRALKTDPVSRREWRPGLREHARLAGMTVLLFND